MKAIKFLLYTGAYMVLITLVWQVYEMKTSGELKPDIFNTGITIILSLSLAGNSMVSDILEKG